MRKPTTATPIPRPGEGKRGEAGHLGYLLRQAGAAHRVRLEHALADLAVTPPQFAVLTMIAAYPGLSNADIARLSLQTPQTASVIVANLLRAGHVARRPHAVHGRIQQIEATTSGLALLKRCRARVMAAERRIAAGLARGEEDVIRRWLVRVAVDARDALER